MVQSSSGASSVVIRHPWGAAFPDVFIHAAESAVKQHAAYAAAKSGEVAAAIALINATFDDAIVEQLRQLGQGQDTVLISVHAQESAGLTSFPRYWLVFSRATSAGLPRTRSKRSEKARKPWRMSWRARWRPRPSSLSAAACRYCGTYGYRTPGPCAPPIPQTS